MVAVVESLRVPEALKSITAVPSETTHVIKSMSAVLPEMTRVIKSMTAASAGRGSGDPSVSVKRGNLSGAVSNALRLDRRKGCVSSTCNDLAV